MGEDGEGNEEEIAGVLEKMMGQLMSKDILYEPLKELHDKFPDYLANAPDPISAEDRKRYEAQQVCVEKIVKVFESPAYSDSDALEMKKVVDLMSEVRLPLALKFPLTGLVDAILRFTARKHHGSSTPRTWIWTRWDASATE